MSTSLSAQNFLKSEAAAVIRKDLKRMMASPDFNTRSTYSPTSVEDLLFVDKHMKYLSQHPNLNPNHYISNLKLMTRVTH